MSSKLLLNAMLGATLMAMASSSAMADQREEAFKARQAEATRNLYQSLSGAPGWPTKASPEQVDQALARRGVKSEDRAAMIALMKQNICEVAEMVPVCRYVGAETVYKLQKLSWAKLDVRENDKALRDAQLRVLEYGTNENLNRLYGEKGLSDAQEAQLDNIAGGDRQRRMGRLSVWLRCGTDERTLSQTGWFWKNYRLKTCGAGIGYRFAVSIFGFSFSLETDVLLSHSRFARKIVTWWQTGAEPQICAQAYINSGTYSCNTNSWSSPFSFNVGLFINQNPASVISKGTASRLGQPFGVNVVHQ